MLAEDFEDDDLDGEEWKNVSKKKKKLRLNPDGPYNLKFSFKKILWDITIENISENDYKVTARSNIKVDPEEINSLKHYLQAEGFEEEAKKHNLYWYLK